MTRRLVCIAFSMSFVLVAAQASAAGIEHLRIEVEHLADNPGVAYVGEPVHLVVTTTNEGDDALKGDLKAFAYTSVAGYFARTKGHAPFRLDEPFDPTGLMANSLVLRPLIVLAPQESTKTEARFLLNPRTGNLWFPGEGEYGVWVVLRPFETHPELKVTSDPIRVVVNAPPERFRDAFEAYISQGLIDLVSDPSRWLSERPSGASLAEKFVAAFGEAPYGRLVRRALRVGLRSRTAYGNASPLEKQVYQRLRDSERVESGGDAARDNSPR